MAIRKEHVVLKIDVTKFAAAMRRAAEATSRWAAAFNRRHPDHHARELPERSAMHAAYDQRRRARRRRSRR